MKRSVPQLIEEEWLKDCYLAFYPLGKVGAWKTWVEEVRQVDVELYPGGRAILRHPDTSYSVEIRWEPVMIRWRGKVVPRPGDLVLTSFHVEPDGDARLWSNEGRWEEASLGLYMTALRLAMQRNWERTGQDAPEDTTPPAAGRPPSTGFYRKALREYQQLIEEGNPGPAQELARRYGKPVGTVKSWLHRGRKYLGEEKTS